MTVEEITGNKLIQEFIGAELHNKLCYEEFGAVDYSQCKGYYNTSFDWLMPVVEKIEGMNMRVEIIFMSCSIYERSADHSDLNAEAHTTSKLKAVWLAVIEFIKWHNSQTIK